ncbi:twin-arginine translocase TatA/TatE family subunit [Paenibacillus sp. KQZ6P-2]|uniref:Sec-independent protein translocase protein TatA n=1 Tax=Paenibacillus mangrovi TaxID=2931978 RepID=A0A9X2B4E2_9BACL|nr:twin-arginine translocase TatA/TatE family subunit [Paenibacillus mangrovi]MCJ8014431.1 twin-arginine translocase TatA/TatE family subunit [Paenibacillus mangrovi]
MNGIGVPGIILLVILALLLFGPNKLPELGRAVGRTFREFKDGTREILGEDDAAARKSEPAKPLAVAPVEAQVAAPVASQSTADNKRLPE